MSEWMWFVVALVGMPLAAACFIKWTDAKVQIEKILKEELHDTKDDSQSC